MSPVSPARDLRRPRFAVASAVALTLALAGSSALAADVKAVDGILQFPNVRVINAPQAVQSVAAPQGGMRAYKDSATGELRGPTTEEMQAAAASSSNLRRASTADASAGSGDGPSFAAAGGGVGVVLDDSSLQYAVMVRQADGSLEEICVTGRDAANEIVKNPSAAKSVARKETSHVR